MEHRSLVILAAYDEARRLRSSGIDTEHLLLGLLKQKGVAAHVLNKMGINVDEVRAAIESRLPAPTAEPVDIKLTPHAKSVLEVAAEEAREMKHRSIGTHHLLLALLQERESLAAQVLEQFGVTLEKVRLAVRAYLIVLLAETGVRSEEAQQKVRVNLTGSSVEVNVPQSKTTEKAQPAQTERRKREVCLSLKTRRALLRAADKALGDDSDTIEFDHLLAAVRELQQEQQGG